MEKIIVGMIVCGAIAFTAKSFISIFQGKKACDCSKGCCGASKNTCSQGLK